MTDNEYSSALLDEYKKYDYVNQDKQKPLIKILVSYIKPSFLFKSEILMPVHLGRAVEKEASKDGEISDEAIQWLHENCAGDDDFEGNISAVNRRVGFLTGTYMAWKNYDKLGNPKYFGSFGYRKLFPPYFLSDLNDYDAILPNRECLSDGSGKKQFILKHSKVWYDIMIEALNFAWADDVKSFEEYFNSSNLYLYEIYVLKRDLFFDFCNWIFPILDYLLKLDESRWIISEKEDAAILKLRQLSNEEYSTKEEYEKYKVRNIAFIIERLTGYYLYKLTLKKDIKIKHIDVIHTELESPFFEKTYIKVIKNLTSRLDELNEKYVIPGIHKDGETINFISVVRDYNLYKKYLADNKFLNRCNNIKFIDINNNDENIAIPERYNRFLDNYNYKKESWFVFCHSDFEIQDDINKILNRLDKNSLYGPIGVKSIKFDNKIYREARGFTYEKERNNGQKQKLTGEYKNEVQEVDTLDCQCIIVHSSLIEKYNLRFDETLKWDLYVEDFCINAFNKYSIKSYAVGMYCIHHSGAAFNPLPLTYYKSLDYLNSKYPDSTFSGSCSFIGGKVVKQATFMEFLKYKVKQGFKKQPL